MVKRAFFAAVRAALVALLCAMPALIVPGVTAEAAQIAVFLGLIAGALVFFEYRSDYPSFIGFRDAPPMNRARFAVLAISLLCVSLVARSVLDPAGSLRGSALMGWVTGAALDFPFSPVRLIVLAAPPDTTEDALAALRSAAGLAYATGLAAILGFTVLLRALDWPLSSGAFNVWTNLPTFEPTGGGDVLNRLERDAHFNIALGFLLPFLIPATLQIVAPSLVVLNPEEPLTAIWVITLWGYVPASLIMRGIALTRVVHLIADKRRRAYRQATARA